MPTLTKAMVTSQDGIKQGKKKKREKDETRQKNSTIHSDTKRCVVRYKT